MATYVKRVLVVLGFLCLIGVGCLSYVVVNFNRPPFPLERLEQLSTGMSRPEVTKALGEPKSVYDDGDTWVYYRDLSWPAVYVRFDHQGRFERAEYDY